MEQNRCIKLGDLFLVTFDFYVGHYLLINVNLLCLVGNQVGSLTGSESYVN